jgi:hypothetical protein
VAWLELPQLILYGFGVLGSSWLAWRLMTGRFAADRTRRIGWAFCLGALLGGGLVVAVTTPDSGPIAILWLYLPYFAFAIWALHFSIQLRRGCDPWTAGRRALRWTFPSLLVVPLAIAIVILLITRR